MELWTAQEAAAFLRISKSSVYAMGQRRQLPVVILNGRRLFCSDSLEAWVRSHEEGRIMEVRP